MRNALFSKPKCLICESDQKYMYDGTDLLYKTTEKNFPIYRCIQCGLESLHPIPSSVEQKSFYPKKYYSYDMKSDRSMLSKLREEIIRSYYTNESSLKFRALQVIGNHLLSGVPKRITGSGNMLDIGCGDETNIRLFESVGWTCKGFEVADKHKLVGKITFAPKFNCNYFQPNTYDFIRVWHVIEHVENPSQFATDICKLLSQTGIVELGLPNSNSLYATCFRKFWYNRDIPRHIHNFNTVNIQLLLEKAGFETMTVRYLSGGGLLGSIQHLLNANLGLKLDLVNNLFLFAIFYPIDMICNLLGIGDCIAVTAKRK